MDRFANGRLKQTYEMCAVAELQGRGSARLLVVDIGAGTGEADAAIL